jgi:hypothetical protein
VLPARVFLPRPGPLTIDILPAIAPGDPEFDTSRGLAKTARQRILAVLDEPDLLADGNDPDE